MKFKATANKLLSNKIVLHIVFAIAFLTVLCYLMTNRIDSIIYFVVLALITSYFSKNMIIILGVPLILVNLFMSKGNIEGFSDKSSSSNDTNNKSLKAKSDKMKAINNNDNNNNNNNTDKSMTPSVKEVNAKRNNNEEAFEIKRNKNKSGFDIDYASTVEDAYDELNKIIGGDGIKKLTSDTQNLMQQQLQLAEAMKGMTPMIEQMEPLLKTASQFMGGMGGADGAGLASISKMAEQFTGKK
jgi:hypothetical protein